ncbi:peptidylprolyl isomerase [Phosphitispora sp. TUW77]|uniref:peptidylprolyl isomerase n=1 Tax=Phosphitispora sp. TUW77 TaxID=3152361 RepID=UPI003AB26589
MNKRIGVFIIIIMVMFLAAAGCAGNREKSSVTSQGSQIEQQAAFDESVLKGKKVGIIETKYGKIYIELFQDEAPGTVENFKKLAEQGFYNGLTFHRYEPGFVIQGGDPEGTGAGGPGYTIKAEINSHKHLKGAVAMARRANDLDSAGSQFYITLEEKPFLDGQYTVFGQVVGGMDAVMKLRAGDIMDKVTVKDF